MISVLQRKSPAAVFPGCRHGTQPDHRGSAACGGNGDAVSESALEWHVSIPPDFRELTEATGFAAANGPWFEKIENGRAIRGFLPGPQHANALGIVHGGMLAAFLDSAMGTAVFHTLERRAVTLRLSLDYLGPGRLGDWLQAE